MHAEYSTMSLFVQFMIVLRIIVILQEKSLLRMLEIRFISANLTLLNYAEFFKINHSHKNSPVLYITTRNGLRSHIQNSKANALELLDRHTHAEGPHSE